MTLVSPGVQVSIIDQSQYLPAPLNSIPLIVLATAQNKANPNGTGVAPGTTAANAGKLYLVTSQSDLVSLYGTPFFYTTSAGTPIQGYELNEYGLLTAYSALGVTNLAYTLRADIDLASLVGSTSRPVGTPTNGTWWLDTAASTWGIYQFNAVTGQFTLQQPIIITDSAEIGTNQYGRAPLDSIGSIGQYAVIAIPLSQYNDNGILVTPSPADSSSGQFYFKNILNQWVRIGTQQWIGANPTIIGTQSNPTLTAGNSFSIVYSGTSFPITVQGAPNNTVAIVASSINALNIGVYAFVINGALVLYSQQTQEPGSNTVPSLQIVAGTGTVLTNLGIPAGTYFQPQAFTGYSSQQPLWQAGQAQPAPSGSVWIKVGTAGNGLNPSIAEWNSTALTWVPKTPNFATSDWDAIADLDSTGGSSIPAGTIYTQFNYDNEGDISSPVYYWERIATGPTVVTGGINNPTFSNGPYTSYVQVSIPGSSSLSSTYTLSVPDNATVTQFLTAWSASGVPFTTATVTSTGAIQLTHTAGGVIVINDSSPTTGFSNGLCYDAGFRINAGVDGVTIGPFSSPTFQAAQTSTSGGGTGLVIEVKLTHDHVYYYNPTTFFNAGTGYAVGDSVVFTGTELGGTSPANDLTVKVGTVNGVTGAVESIYFVSGYGAGGLTNGAGTTQTYAVQLTNWYPFEMTAQSGPPNTLPASNTNWYYSVIDQVDIMVNTTTGWKGYSNVNYNSVGFPLPNGTNMTDPNGPLVSPTTPTTQYDGTPLVYGDIWIDTSDLEVYPLINRWQSVSGIAQWVALDNADQVSSSGVVFADARWGTSGAINPATDPIPTIQSMLTSNYLDLDAPDHTLYPVGMLLFNTRRSGYNVKRFATNYFTSASYPDAGLYDPGNPTNTSNLPEYSYTWVSESGLRLDGSPYMGRQAQRQMVVKALKSAIETNQDIRDEDNAFNLMATPAYPECIPDMVVLNGDRGETTFIIGDTPMRLPNDATTIQTWAQDATGTATPYGQATRNTYVGLFYPSGLTTDLAGNAVAVPPSYMMIRTFLRNDTVAYPWFAAAGTNRGIIDNATNIGYINGQTGEFVSIKPNQGLRDVLYTNNINPLVYFTGNGLLCYGNISSYASQTALDRINVVRLICYLRTQLYIAARPFVFEPNDAITRASIAGVIQSLMVTLVAKRGIYDYLVICDTSNNTPTTIDQNQLWVDVAIEPVKAVEFIYIPVRVLATGTLGNK